uniref:Uncharacterized protein n=1 Tax=Arundo donax TaxID=35708 RepID=A0A0A9BXF9_ARUDO
MHEQRMLEWVLGLAAVVTARISNQLWNLR